MLDPAIITALNPPMPPEIPRMVEERVWLSDLAVQAERIAKRRADAYEAATSEWIRKVTALHESLGQLPPPPPDAETKVAVSEMTEAIEMTEAEAERRARWRSRFAKRAARHVKRRFAEDPSVGAVERAFVARLLEIDDRMIEAMLNHALVLRAARSDWDPSSRGGAVHSSSEALTADLRTSLAA